MRRFLILPFLLSTPVLADYAWLPDYQKLNLRAGLDLRSSSANFANDGSIDDLTYLNRPASFKDTAFWVEPEYGVAEDWSLWGRLTFLGGSVSDANQGTTLASGSGLGDSLLGIKWGVKPTYPIVTLETFVKMPTGNAAAATNAALATGDGAIDLGFRLHSGTRAGMVLFSLSPGFLARFGGYSSAFTADAAAQLRFRRAYFRAFIGFFYSLTPTELFDSRIDRHDAAGSGGTYARLAGSPVVLNVGGKLGVDVTRTVILEGSVSQTTYGMRAPYGLTISLAALITFDFYKPVVRRRLREVPFEGEQPIDYPVKSEEEDPES